MIFISPPPQFGQCALSMSKTLEQPRPGDAVWPGPNRLDIALAGHCDFGGPLLYLGLLRHQQRTQPGVGCQDAMEPDEMQARPRYQRRQPLHEFQRAHDQVPCEAPVHRPGAACRSIAPRRLELELHLPGGVELHPFVRQRGAGDVAPIGLMRE
jgi:hypothetical protein